jgi:hypothetical protein
LVGVWVTWREDPMPFGMSCTSARALLLQILFLKRKDRSEGGGSKSWGLKSAHSFSPAQR